MKNMDEDRPQSDRISELENELRREVARELEVLKSKENLPPLKGKRKAGRGPKLHAGTVFLAVNYLAATQTGSLYSTILRVLAERGHLDLHKALFDRFQGNPSTATAKKLLQKIGVAHLELERLVRADQLFRAHCQKRTRQLIARAARGDKRAKSIMTTPEICDKHGRWRGDLEEALNILYGGRAPVDDIETHTNTKIIRDVGLLFDRSMRGNTRFYFLYPVKYYAIFQRARALAGE